MYDEFLVENELQNYRLTVGNYSHSASTSINKMKPANGRKFTTKDRDNDNVNNRNCAAAAKCGGGFWYNKCYCSVTGAGNKFRWYTSNKKKLLSAEMYVLRPQ